MEYTLQAIASALLADPDLFAAFCFIVPFTLVGAVLVGIEKLIEHSPPVTVAAKFFIWALFLLITDQTLVIMDFKFGLPVKPTYAYAIIASGLLVSGLMIHRSAKPLMSAKPFFLPFLALAALAIIMYRGENPGPDFDALPWKPSLTPSSISYAIWPALNLVACAGLYLLAGKFRRTIVLAAFTALVIQVATMEADMWWFALFGDPNGRAGGLAQNANVAALLVVVLASLTLSTRLAPYAVTLALAGVLLSQSKTGFGAAAVLAISLLFTRPKISRPSLAFASTIALSLSGTLYFSPVLNPPPDQLVEIACRKAHSQNVAAVLDCQVTLQRRIEARTSMDESVGLRWTAAKFFAGIVMNQPFGLGTGFTNRFTTGPHNSFLKLAADNGIFAAAMLLVLLASVTWCAYRSRSPQMFALAGIAWIGAALFHTLMVDPIVLPALAIGIGLQRRASA